MLIVLIAQGLSIILPCMIMIMLKLYAKIGCSVL